MAWWFDWTKLELKEVIEIPNEPIDITINYPSLEILLVYLPLVFGVGVLGNLLCWWVDNKFDDYLVKRIKIRDKKRMMEMWHP